jgi:enoyl-CoA hydratase/carnithine racemase
MDLAEVRPDNPEEINQAHEQLFTIGARLVTPVIAVVEGAALGGGTGLVANCHIAIASAAATFGLTEIRLGLWPFLVFRSVTAAIGERRAVELALTGRIVNAAEAREMSLIHEVTEHMEKRALDVARGLSESSPTAIRSGLTFVQQSRGKDWQSAGAIARRVRDEVFESEDFQEGLAAFREKRAARWPSLSAPR